jgi:hypothetical protein
MACGGAASFRWRKYRALVVPISDSCQPRWLRIQKGFHKSVGRIILLFHFTFCAINFSVLLVTQLLSLEQTLSVSASLL